MRTTDNNCGELLSKLDWSPEFDEIKDILAISNKTIKDLVEEENLLIFPHSLNAVHNDLESSEYVFSLHQNSNEDYILTTKNVMGFVGRNKTQLTVSSRFYSNGDDYFLHYMLHKVFAINIFDLEHSTDKDSIWDFLIYLFPYYLKKALNQGLFKEYQRKEYNDANVKGSINIARHIRINNPFSEKIAYRTREHSYDNSVTQLIRHTIEYIKVHKFGNGILFNDSDTKNSVNQIIYATPTFEKNSRQKIINQNIRPLNHPYFTEYALFQKICLQILRQDGLTYGKEKDKVYGLLFDGAWLWEEYLSTILKQIGYIHPENRNKNNPVYLFKQSKVERFPDFYKLNEEVLDAKYKRLAGKEAEHIDRNDMHQIIAYMHVMKLKRGGFIFPTESKNLVDKGKYPLLGSLNGYAGDIFLYGIPIIQEIKRFPDFCSKMKEIEIDFSACLQRMYDPILIEPLPTN